MKKTWVLWVLAVLITVAAVIYQRLTGPTHPKKVSVEIGNKEYNFKLLRSHEIKDSCIIEMEIPDNAITGTIHYRRYPLIENEEWTVTKLSRDNDYLKGGLPMQPQAGKIAYYFTFNKDEKTYELKKDNPVVVRFKGFVPKNTVLYPHILMMFLAMFFSNVAALFALARKKRFKLWGNITFILLLVGGLILGPIMQKYAFGDYWTGIPFGWDLTDNKTLIAFIFWILAVAMNIKKQRPIYVIIAAFVMLVIYCIPHSVMGSEFNHESGKVVTGFIQYFRLF